MANINLDQYIKNLDSAIKDFDNFNMQWLAKQAESVNKETIQNTPVKDGDLKRAWTVGKVKKTVKDFYVKQYNPMNYASFIEDGTKNEDDSWRIEPFMMSKIAMERFDRRKNTRYSSAILKWMRQRGIN